MLNSKRASGLVSLILLVAALAHTGPASAATCNTSGPSGGAYTVTVCLVEPLEGAILTGRIPVSATVSKTAGAPAISQVIFRINGNYELTDAQAPYSFDLATDRRVDGPRTLSVDVLLSGGFKTQPTTANVTFSNGVTTPPVNTDTFTPRTGSPTEEGEPFSVYAVGDSASGRSSDRAVADFIVDSQPNLFLYLADVYERGTSSEFENFYGTGSNYLSRLNDITNPSVGNHEYDTPGAAGYFDYWDNVPNHYSVETAGWQIIALDSNPDSGQLTPGTGQYEWLQTELQNPNPCKLVFYHHPRFSPDEAHPSLDPIWRLMANNGVDIALSGHDHNYQRWAPLDADGNVSGGGTTQFVAGTGGKSVNNFTSSDPRLEAAVKTAPDAHGALRLDLGSAGAAYRYVSAQGVELDHGSLACEASHLDDEAPATPGEVSAGFSQGAVELSWSESADDVGVTGYEIYRDGAKIDTVGPGSTYRDPHIAGDTTYEYTVLARDDAGNTSSPAIPTIFTTPAITPPFFTDAFEDGSMSEWTFNKGLVLQTSETYEGAAARATTAGTSTFARLDLATPTTDLYYATRFKVISQTSDPVYLQRFRTSPTTWIAGTFLTKKGEIGLRHNLAGLSFKSGAGVATAGWHDLQVHLEVDGANSRTQVWLDDQPIHALTRSESLGTNPITRIELGDSASGRTYDHVYDEVALSSEYANRPLVVSPTDIEPPSVPSNLAAAATSDTEVELTWDPSTDDVGVAAYEIYRDNSLVASVPDATTYTDTGLTPGATYTYHVKAFDGAGNDSGQSDDVALTMPQFLFKDGFESGNLSKWSTTKGTTVQTSHVLEGTKAARIRYTTTAGFARKNLGSSFTELYASIPFKLIDKPNNAMYLSRLRNGSGGFIGGPFIDFQNKLRWRSNPSNVTRQTGISVDKNVWYELEYHVVIAGESSLTEVWLDGTKILTATDGLGLQGARTFQIGESKSGQDAVFDLVAVDSEDMP